MNNERTTMNSATAYSKLHAYSTAIGASAVTIDNLLLGLLLLTDYPGNRGRNC